MPTDIAPVIRNTALQLRHQSGAKPTDVFRTFAQPLFDSFGIAKVTVLLMLADSDRRDAVVTGYALEAQAPEASALVPRRAAEQLLFGERPERLDCKEWSRYVENTAVIFGGETAGGSAFALHLDTCKSSQCFVFSKSLPDGFSSDEREALTVYTESLSPCLQSVFELELPGRSYERRRFRERLRTEARGEPNAVLDAVALLWQELLHAGEATLWLYNELSRKFVLSGCAPRDRAPDAPTFLQDNGNPEAQCYAQRKIGYTNVKDLSDERRARAKELECHSVHCIPLLYRVRDDQGVQEACLGVLSVLLKDGEDPLEHPDLLLGLARDSALAIQESFTSHRLGILKEFNDLVSQTLGGLTNTAVNDLKKGFYDGFFGIVHKHMGVHGISIFQASDDEASVVCVATTGLEGDPDLRKVQYHRGEGGTGTIFADGKPRITLGDEELLQGKYIEKKKLQKSRDVPFLGVPIIAGQRIVGVVRCVEKLSPFNEELLPFSRYDLEDLQFIVNQLGPVMQMIKLQELRELGISAAVHDIRAPAGTLRDAAHFLRSRLKALGVYEQVRYEVDDLHDTALRLLTIVNLAGRVVGVAFRPNRKKVNLEGDIMARLKAMLYEQARAHDNRIHFEGFDKLPPVSVDPDLMEQVLFNLLVNAIKYSFPKTDIDIFAEVLKTKRAFQIRFRNWGDPIAREEAEKLFLPFYRGTAGKRRGSGQGLGLYIVKEIIEAHGGEVQISRMDQPTEFTVELPL